MKRKQNISLTFQEDFNSVDLFQVKPLPNKWSWIYRQLNGVLMSAVTSTHLSAIDPHLREALILLFNEAQSDMFDVNKFDPLKNVPFMVKLFVPEAMKALLSQALVYFYNMWDETFMSIDDNSGLLLNDLTELPEAEKLALLNGAQAGMIHIHPFGGPIVHDEK